MKKSITVLVTIIIMSGMSLRAQNTNVTTTGVYLTEQDYKANKLSYILNDGSKLHLNEFLNGKNISFTYQGKETKLSKSEIYGYRLNNQDYRFQNNVAYKIVDTAGFYIYSHEKLVQQGKGPKPTMVYYFSTKADAGISPLTAENIAMAFPQNHKFRYMVEAEYKSDIKLYTYDNESDTYEIKELYHDSLK
jgi:hypothetical protein